MLLYAETGSAACTQGSIRDLSKSSLLCGSSGWTRRRSSHESFGSTKGLKSTLYDSSRLRWIILELLFSLY